MSSKILAKKIRALESSLMRDSQKLAQLKRRAPRELVEDYTLNGPSGLVKLSALFGKKDDLIVIHNMGAGCRYCTMWADGFNGVYPHLADRAAFVVVSPDLPKAQKKFAHGRGWRFPMVSCAGTPFCKDLGFQGSNGCKPGISTFQRKGKKIYRVASAGLGPFDLFCSVWHIIALLADGVNDWSPQYQY